MWMWMLCIGMRNLSGLMTQIGVPLEETKKPFAVMKQDVRQRFLDHCMTSLRACTSASSLH
jgi:hypothetical protein